MSHLENNLLIGESIVYRAHLHWAIYFRPILLGLFSLIVCLAGAEMVVFTVFMFIILVIPMGLSAIINRTTSEFTVTNKRVMMKFGFLRRTSLEVLLTKVEGISVDQGILGRVLGYGTIVVSGTGGSKTPFPIIADPMRFRREVQEQIEKKAQPAFR